MLVTDSGQCQPLKYLKKNRETAPTTVHHPRACRAFAFETSRGFVIVRIEDKAENNRKFNECMRSVKATFEQFLKEGESYD
jgi:hypothetical protein